jgi:hypothetical protein
MIKKLSYFVLTTIEVIAEYTCHRRSQTRHQSITTVFGTDGDKY